MKNTPSSFSTKKKMSLDGSVYMVRLLEIDLQQVTFSQDKRIVWPQLEKDTAAPVVDGVLLLHDATHPDNFSEAKELIGMFGQFCTPCPSPLQSRGCLWSGQLGQTCTSICCICYSSCIGSLLLPYFFTPPFFFFELALSRDQSHFFFPPFFQLFSWLTSAKFRCT